LLTTLNLTTDYADFADSGNARASSFGQRAENPVCRNPYAASLWLCRRAKGTSTSSTGASLICGVPALLLTQDNRFFCLISKPFKRNAPTTVTEVCEISPKK